jgi:hypothetical protein
MISRKMKLLSAAVGAAVLITSAALARTVHKEAAPVDQANHQASTPNAVVGPDGRLIGVAADPSIRSQIQRDGLPN